MLGLGPALLVALSFWPVEGHSGRAQGCWRQSQPSAPSAVALTSALTHSGQKQNAGLLAGDWLVASSRHGLQESWPQWANGRDRACPPGWWTQLSQVLGEGSLLPVPYIVSFLSFFSHFKTIIFTVFERQGDRDAGSSLILQQPRLDQANAKSLKLHPGLPRGWWEAQYLRRHLGAES